MRSERRRLRRLLLGDCPVEAHSDRRTGAAASSHTGTVPRRPRSESLRRQGHPVTAPDAGPIITWVSVDRIRRLTDRRAPLRALVLETVRSSRRGHVRGITPNRCWLSAAVWRQSIPSRPWRRAGLSRLAGPGCCWAAGETPGLSAVAGPQARVTRRSTWAVVPATWWARSLRGFVGSGWTPRSLRQSQRNIPDRLSPLDASELLHALKLRRLQRSVKALSPCRTDKSGPATFQVAILQSISPFVGCRIACLHPTGSGRSKAARSGPHQPADPVVQDRREQRRPYADEDAAQEGLGRRAVG
jgi:hypothetical protein